MREEELRDKFRRLVRQHSHRLADRGGDPSYQMLDELVNLANEHVATEMELAMPVPDLPAELDPDQTPELVRPVSKQQRAGARAGTRVGKAE